MLDDRVRIAIAKLADSRWLEAAGDDEWIDESQVNIDALVAGFVREAIDPGDDEWRPVDLSVADLDNLDQFDRAILEDLVRHRFTVEQITDMVERQDYSAWEEPDAYERLAEFRDRPDGTTGRDDGAGVGRAPVGAAGGA